MINGGGFKTGAMPKSITCYICGRGYGTRSIKIHLKSCIKKWDIIQSRKPKKERRPCPTAPKGFDQMMSKKKITRKDIQKVNEEAFEEYNETALEMCPYCHRSFNYNAFKRHGKICSEEKPFNPLNKDKIKAYKEYKK